MIDVRKLITGFLVLAAGGAVAALIIGGIANATPSDNTAIIVAAATPTSSDLLTGNAFVNDPSDQNSGDDLLANNSTIDPTLDSSTNAALNDPNNLTAILTNAYLNNLALANPDGPQTDSSGNETFTSPDNDTVIAQFEASSTDLQNFQIPDWNFEADQIPITVADSSSSDALVSYTNALKNLFTDDLIQTNLQSMLAGSVDPGTASYAGGELQTMLQDVGGLQTPPGLVAFQKSLITMLVYEKNTAALVENSSDDPLKSSLILQGESDKYDSAVQAFATQLQDVSTLTGFSLLDTNSSNQAEKSDGAMAFVDNIFGIKEAHAIFGLGDIDFDPTNFAQTLKTYAENILLQILKNYITILMQKTVLTWIRGAGVPRFVQQFGTTLVNSFTTAATNALNQQMGCLDPTVRTAIAPLFKVSIGGGTGANYCASQFQNQLRGNNLTSFYNNFNNGGFNAYFQMLQPGGNMFGDIIDLQDTALSAGAQSQQATQLKITANQGWNGTQVCDDGSNPNGTSAVCSQGSATSAAGQQQQEFPGSSCPSGWTYVTTIPNEGSCTDGSEPITQTPGQVTGQVFNSAVDSSGKLTAAANDVAGILDAFLSSLLNSIATNAITAANGALQSALSGGGGTSGGSAGTGNNTNTSVPLQCVVTPNVPSRGSFLFTAAGGETISASGAISTPQYTWSSPGSTPATGSGTSFQTTFTAQGTYTILLSDTVDNVNVNCSATY